MPIDPLPSISRSDANFRTQVDDYFLTRLPAFSTQAESARVQIVAAESTTTSAASTAATAATTATTAAGTATSASSAAVTAKNAAELAAAQAVSGNVATPIHAATAKTAPADADELGIADSAASWGLKKLTFANLKAWIGGLFVSKYGDTISGNLNVTGNVLVTGGALGYGTGAGGSVTQATSKSTPVTLNKPCGRITTHTASLAAGATINFVVGNAFAENGYVVSVNTDSSDTGDFYRVSARAAAGLFIIRLTNTSGAPLAEAVSINFAVTKVATS